MIEVKGYNGNRLLEYRVTLGYKGRWKLKTTQKRAEHFAIQWAHKYGVSLTPFHKDRVFTESVGKRYPNRDHLTYVYSWKWKVS